MNNSGRLALGNTLFKKIKKGDFDALFGELKKHGPTYGPVKTGRLSYAFMRVDSPGEMDLSYTRTMIPVKKFFVRPREVIFHFDEDTDEFSENIEEETNAVIFGVHHCDINGLNLLDRIYLDEMPDRYYAERRANSIVVGVSCQPDENCFCGSLGTSYALEGYDLFLHDIDDGYLVSVGTEKGHHAIRGAVGVFSEPEPGDIVRFKAKERERLDSFEKGFETSGIQDLLGLSFEDPLWEEYAEECLGCGTCNLVCPTCRCYDSTDYLDLDIKSGERARTWDSCMLKNHGLVAGGLNFRPTRVERLRNRFNCKGSLREGMPNCVGCGRCTVYCPAKIDYVEVMRRVRGEP